MKYPLNIAISVVAVLLAVGHLVFPGAKIDAITLALMARLNRPPGSIEETGVRHLTTLSGQTVF